MGKKLSEQHKKKISVANKGKVRANHFRQLNSLNKRGTNNTFAVLDEDAVLWIREQASNGMMYKDIAEFVPIGAQMVGKIVRRENWKYI